jgi:hypothetical protein
MKTWGKWLLGIIMFFDWFLFINSILLINGIIAAINNGSVVTGTDLNNENPLAVLFSSMIMSILLPVVNVTVGVQLLFPQLIIAGITLIIGIIVTIVFLVKVWN